MALGTVRVAGGVISKKSSGCLFYKDSRWGTYCMIFFTRIGFLLALEKPEGKTEADLVGFCVVRASVCLPHAV